MKKIKKVKHILIIGFAVIAALTAVLVARPQGSVPAAAPDNVIEWGVRHRGMNNMPEVDPRGAELLKKYDGLYVGDPTQNKVYFTFDLGYEAGYTDKVLDILGQNNIQGIFFLCGNYLKEETLIRRMIDEGHSIGNHTNHHRDLPKVSEQKAIEDISSLQSMFKQNYGRDLVLFRPPSGHFNEHVLQIVKARGLKTIMWSVAYVDWGTEATDVGASLTTLTKRLHPGAIVLMHITNKSTPEILRKFIERLNELGYTAGTPEELINYRME